MLIPAAEESVTVVELRHGDKIIDDGETSFVSGTPELRDGEVVVSLSAELGGEVTPYGFTPGHRVARVLVDASVSESTPGRHVLPGSA